jgi:HSP20 family protein
VRACAIKEMEDQMRSLLPWGRGKDAPAPRFTDDDNPFALLHREMNRLFDDVFHGFDLPASRSAWMSDWPRLDVADDGKTVTVTAELPGLSEKDVELTLEDGVLTIKGETASESRGPQYSERWQGKFRRTLSLGPDIDPDRVQATFKNGLLTVRLDKVPETERTARRIPIAS